MLMKFFVLFCVITIVFGKCRPFDGRTGIGYLNVCTSKEMTDCKTVSSIRRTCINLINGPYNSGHTNDENYECQIWSEKTCKGKSEIVRFKGLEFSFEAKSFACPFKCD